MLAYWYFSQVWGFFAHDSLGMRHRIWKNIGFDSKLKLKNDVVDTELKADLEIFVQINFFML